jgi:hypothetical protein
VLFSVPTLPPPPPNARTVDVDFFPSVFFFLADDDGVSERGGKPATMDAAAAAAHFEERERDRERGVRRVSFEW